MKLVVKIVTIVGALAVQGVLAWFLMDWYANRPAETDIPAEEEVVEKAYEYGAIFMLNDLVINPSGSVGRRIFKISLALEYDPANTVLGEEMQTRSPFMRDHLIQYLGALNETTLSDIAYRETMRDSLTVALNRFLEEGQLDRVLFQDFIRQ
jgi:flagellar basal body-associated protein FliL